ncbi:MAG: hypothetical protein RLZZ427_1448 [Pseudomonadota bacterium]|jgi:hypothetical protein
MRIGFGVVAAVGLIAGLAAADAAYAQGRPAAPGPVKVSEQTPLIHFEYAYPAAVQAIPVLRARFEVERFKARASLLNDAVAGRKDAKEGGYDFTPYYLSTTWLVVTNLPGWLSLSGATEAFTGGAHGMQSTAALLWDKAAQRERAVTDLFVSKAAFSAAIREPFCARLDAERAVRRGVPVDRASGDGFDECIDPAESTVMLGSADKAHFTRIGIEVDPYVAGPYAEGSYSITVPVTPAVLRALKPEYRAAFAIGR